MRDRRAPQALLALALIALASCASAKHAAQRSYPRVAVTVGSRPTGRPLPAGFVGFSFEYTAVEAYARPAVIHLIRELAPGQTPILRIGGNSTDETWWPQPAEARPRQALYALSDRWLASARALAAALGAKLILGLNLAGGSPVAARDESRAFLRGIGGRYIGAFEIGNEPDLYGLFPWPQGPNALRRAPSYDLRDYLREFSRWRTAIGRGLPVTGPAYATYDWSLRRFIAAEPGLAQVTFHHYPLDACLTKRSAPGYPTIARLLSEQSSDALAGRLTASVQAAHAHHVGFRLDELNSASCGGKAGVSDSPASALWMLDTLFALAKASVDGVNVHTFPGAVYAPFSPAGSPNPEYYGMLMFARAFPPGARLVPVTVSPRGALKAWATTAGRVVLINKSINRSCTVALDAPGLPPRLRVERLRGARSTASADAITVPAESAVLLTR